MIAIDTNVLVAIHRTDAQGHAAARAAYVAAGGDTTTWALPWPCVHEFIAVVTHPRIFAQPTPLADAISAIQAWRDRPGVRFLAEDDGYWAALTAVSLGALITGPRIHDARIAALCLDHGVRELWTADRDFSRFPRLRTRNPLVA